MKSVRRLALCAAILLLLAALPASASAAYGLCATTNASLPSFLQPNSPHPAATLSGCGFYCFGGGTTTTVKGFGTDCTTAQSSLDTQLHDQVDTNCATGFPPCSFTETITIDCHQKKDGQYVVGGYATYVCQDTSC